MAKTYRPDDYLYASARIRAMEVSLPTRENLWQFAEAPGRTELFRLMAANGIEGEEEAPETVLANAFRAASEAAPGDDAFRFLRIAFDANNIKTMEKCRVRGISPDGILSPLGTVSPEKLAAGYEDGKFEGFPAALAAAIPAAREAFSRTHSPREFDLILDRAAAKDARAAASPYPFAAKMQEMRVDLINILTFLRLSRVGMDDTVASLFDEAFLPGGTLTESFFRSFFREDEAALSAALVRTPYAALFAGEDLSLSALEKRADDLTMNFVKSAKYITFGAEVVIAYLFAAMTAAKNLRIVLAGKSGGKSAEAIKESLRENYV